MDTIPRPVGETPSGNAAGLAELSTGDFETSGGGAGSEAAVFFLFRAILAACVSFVSVLAEIPPFFCAVLVDFRLAVRVFFATFIPYWPRCVTANGSRAL
jgi:hypothetical protein